MANVNKVILIGNLTRDPELKNSQTGTTVLGFALAIYRKYVVMGVVKEETAYVDVTAFARVAELVAQSCKKGSSLFVEGRLKLETWKTNAGQNRSKLAVVAENIQFLGGPQNTGQRTGRLNTPESNPNPPSEINVPF